MLDGGDREMWGQPQNPGRRRYDDYDALLRLVNRRSTKRERELNEDLTTIGVIQPGTSDSLGELECFPYCLETTHTRVMSCKETRKKKDYTARRHDQIGGWEEEEEECIGKSSEKRQYQQHNEGGKRLVGW
jgi:hypothetical protein